MMIKILISTILSYLLMRAVVPYFRKIALASNFLDVANEERKTHTESVPLVGGPAIGVSIFITLVLASSGLGLFTFIPTALLGGSIVLLLTGAIDDKMMLNPFLKLAIQFCTAFYLVYQGAYFDVLFELVGFDSVPTIVQKAITILFVIGVINAYNLMDGIDGLAGSLFLTAFFWFGMISLFFGQYDMALTCAIISGALVGFLRFNLSSGQKIFLGDSGSLSLGFIIASLAISTIENAAKTDLSISMTMGTLAIISIPLLDEARVFLFRMYSGRSPFYADRTHIHHIFLQINAKHGVVRKWIMWVVAVNFAVVTCLTFFGGFFLAALWCVVGALFLTSILQIQTNMHAHRSELRRMEMRHASMD